MSFTTSKTYGNYRHLHSSGSLGVPATSTGSAFDFTEVDAGLGWYNSAYRLNVSSVSKQTNRHIYRLPVDGNTYTSSSLPPCICVYFWKRVS